MKNFINLIGCLFLLVFSATNVHAQQQASFSLYNQFEGIYNPSSVPDEYTIYEHNLIFGAATRRQWANLSTAPKTQFLKGEYITQFENTFNLLMGGYITNDQAGPISITGVSLRLAGIMSNYDPVLGGISAGLHIGATQYRINTTSLQSKYPNDILTAQNTQASKPQLSLGVSYYNSFKHGIFADTKLNTGFSITNLGFNQKVFKDQSNEFDLTTNLHYYAYAKIRKSFYSEQALEFNTWIRYTQNIPMNADIHMIFDVNDNFSLELGLNTSGTAHGGIGLNLYDIFSNDNLMHIEYAFNPSFLQAGGAFGNTHEVSINYSFKR